MTTALTPDVLSLLAAIDDDDDSALPILADALEEAGDVRAEGVRWVTDLDVEPTSVTPPQRWLWVRGDEQTVARCDTLVPVIFDRLTGGEERLLPRGIIGGLAARLVPDREYPSRSAAFMALAEALISS
jgi:hypothetical protein